jgi:hypothetical protein
MMNIWFWMDKAVKIGIDHGTLLVWIFVILGCDVTWVDSSKGESSREQWGKTRHGV